MDQAPDLKPYWPEMDWCADCEGTGRQPTEAGRQLLAFLHSKDDHRPAP
ncbi:hypothetical protein ACIO3O_40135 [Streptomyces sp. NPDC087440]